MEFVRNHFEICLFIVAGIVFALRARSLIMKARRIDRDGVETDAVVTRIVIQSIGTELDNDSFTTYVQYTDDQGKLRESPMSLDLTRSYDIDQKVRIKYIPGNYKLVREVKAPEEEQAD